MTRADEFLRIYNELASHLMREVKAGNHMSFMRLVNLAARKNAQIRYLKDDLRDMAELRNAIVHHRSYPDDIIAEPNGWALKKFKKIYNQIVKPAVVYPTFRKTIHEFGIDTPLTQALEYMKKNDFRQIVVRDNNKDINLLTNEGISKWLAGRSKETELNISTFTIMDAIAYEDEGHFMLLSRDEPVTKARDAFDNSSKPIMPELCAIIITQNALPHEKALGIITPWDLLDLKNQ